MTTINSEDRALIELKPQSYAQAVEKIGRIGAFAPGNYVSMCVRCGVQFDGDKRAINCLPCAVAARTEGSTEARASGEAPVAFYDPEHWRRVGPGREQCSTIYPAPAGTYRTPLYAAPLSPGEPRQGEGDA